MGIAEEIEKGPIIALERGALSRSHG